MADEIYLTPEEDDALDRSCQRALAPVREKLRARGRARRAAEQAAKEAQESNAKSDKK